MEVEPLTHLVGRTTATTPHTTAGPRQADFLRKPPGLRRPADQAHGARARSPSGDCPGGSVSAVPLAACPGQPYVASAAMITRAAVDGPFSALSAAPSCFARAAIPGSPVSCPIALASRVGDSLR
jgi:hypothetical protein